MSIGSSISDYLKTLAKGTTPSGFPTSKSVDANTQATHVTLAEQLPVGTNPIGSVSNTQSALATGNITSAVSVIGPVSIVASNLVTVVMTGTYAGVSSFFEVSQNGTDWFTIQGRVTDGSIVNGFSGYTNASVAVDISVGGWTQLRVRTTAWTSGTAVITLIAKSGSGDRTPSSLSVGYTAEGNPVFSFPPLLMGGSDGVNARMARFKGASTAALASDPSLVVALSPNSIGTFNLASGGLAIGTRADGFLRAQIDPTTLMVDTFETLDTTNVWTIGGTVLPVGSAGVLTVSAGTAASGSSYAQSKPTFLQGSSSFLQTADVVTLSAAVETGNKRFWGLGIIQGAPTAAAPLTNGAVFEILDTDGLLYGAVYSNGVRTQSLALTRPTDGLVHRYGTYFKTSRIYFEVDNVSVGSIAFPNTQVSALAKVIGSINGLGILASSATLTATILGVSDTGRNATKLADGTYPWRTMQIGKSGGVSVKGAVIIGASASVAAAGTGTIGPVDVSEAGNVTFVVKNTVAASAYAGTPVLVFEQSDDNVSWGPLSAVRSDTSASSSTFTLAANTASASLMFDSAVEGVNWVRCRVTTGPATNAMTIVIATGGMPFSPAVTSVNQPITKGVQGTTGVTTQDLKDSGRVMVTYTATALAGVTAEALVSLTPYRDLAAGTAATTHAVTAGKRLRLQTLTLTMRSTSTVNVGGLVRFRMLGGAVLVGSPVHNSVACMSSNLATAVIGNAMSYQLTFPDGFELSGAMQFGLTQLASAITATMDVQVTGYEY